jgi:hypothetical protein
MKMREFVGTADEIADVLRVLSATASVPVASREMQQARVEEKKKKRSALFTKWSAEDYVRLRELALSPRATMSDGVLRKGMQEKLAKKLQRSASSINHALTRLRLEGFLPVVQRRWSNRGNAGVDSDARPMDAKVAQQVAQFVKNARPMQQQVAKSELAVALDAAVARRVSEQSFAEALAEAPTAHKKEPDVHYMQRKKPSVPSDGTGARVAAFNRSREVVRFPELKNVQVPHDVIESIIKHVISSQGALRFEMDGPALGIDTAALWREFVDSVLWHSGEIARFFGVPNHFVVEKIGRQMQVMYKA